jgi:hypothetical protein
LKKLLQTLLVPDPSMPGNHAPFGINTMQQFRYEISVAFQVDQIVNPGGGPKTPVACADWTIVPSSRSAASQRVQQPSIEARPDSNWVRFWHQVRTNLEPIS